MERIVIEVEDSVAKNWQRISPEIKSSLEKVIEKQIKELSNKAKESNFEALLRKASDEAAQNGLTEEILQRLLNEE